MFLRVTLAEQVVIGQPLGFPILKIWETLPRRLCLKLERRHQRPLEAGRDDGSRSFESSATKVGLQREAVSPRLDCEYQMIESNEVFGEIVLYHFILKLSTAGCFSSGSLALEPK